MSGDVQPRKRKDKKRRKDDEPVPVQSHTPIYTNNLVNDDVNIHVHKEGGTGGGICAKLVFFVLLSALAVLIGLIITEHRGLTDLETADSESKFSQLFEGWIDSSSNSHDDHDLEDVQEADHDDDHDDEHEEVDLSEDEEDHQASEEDEEHGHSEENEDHQLSEEDDEGERSEEENEDGENESAEEDIEDDGNEDEETDMDEEKYSEEENEDVEDHNSDEEVADERDNQNEEEYGEDQAELKVSDEEEEEDGENDDEEEEQKQEENDEDEVADEDIVDEEETKTATSSLEKDTLRKGEEKISQKKFSKRSNEVESTPADDPEETSNVAVKVGVGIAILMVAYVVLIRKWRSVPADTASTEETSTPTPDLSRRNTIIVPPTYQEVEQDIEHDDEDYSDEEDSEDDNQKPEQKSAKWRYQELRSTYSQSLTPESGHSEPKYPKSNEGEYDVQIDDEAEEEVEISEEDYEIEDEYDDEEEEELLKRLEAKYFKVYDREESEAPWKRITPQEQVGDSDSDRQSDDAEYEHMNITNKEDFFIKHEIDEAQKSVDSNPNYAIRLFDTILRKFPSSPRSLYGKALAMDRLADQKRSNSILENALKLYLELIRSRNVPDPLFELAAERCLNRMRFIGQYSNAIMVHKLVIDRFSNIPKHMNDMAITYLTINRIDDARSVLKRVLARWPDDGVALVHYGFILKTADNKLKSAVNYLRKGILTGEKGVLDGRFFFHLGDALTRLGRNEEAMKVYEQGTEHKLFLSKYQRSLYNVPRLTGKPWWQPEDLPYLPSFELLKKNWRKIKEEALSVLNVKGYFQDESENLKDTGDWKQFELYARGKKNSRNCARCPFTCSVLDQIPEAAGCKRGQTKFSVIHPGTHIWPHCGPTNCRLRTHLGLKVPPGTYLRVGSETRSWKEGEILIFDDSYEHEVWHNGTEFRLVLIVDVWHPGLTPSEKKNISPI